MNHPDIRRAALVAENGRRLLVIEAAAIPGGGFRESLTWAQLDEIRPMPRLPVDKRHNAKIDYPALREMLRERA
jgi:hypothetical protein